MSNPFESFSAQRLDAKLHRPGEEPQEHDGTVSSFAHNLLESFAYCGWQSPVNGLVQLADHEGKSILPHVQWMSAPTKARAFSSDWVAQQLGSGLGTMAQFAAVGYLVHDAALASAERTALFSTERTLGTLAVGAGYGGLLTPVDPGKDFWQQRITNAALGLASFGAMEGVGSVFQASADISLPLVGAILRHEPTRAVLSGLTVGSLTADLNSEIQNGRSATGQERLESALSFAMINGAMAGGGMLHRDAPLDKSAGNLAGNGNESFVSYGRNPYQNQNQNQRSQALAMPLLPMVDRQKMLQFWGDASGREKVLELYKSAHAGVVRVEASGPSAPDGFNRFGSPRHNESSTGWFLNDQGHIVTNAHSVKDMTDFEIRFNGQSAGYPYQVERTLPQFDLAILRPSPGVLRYLPNFRPLPRAATSDSLKVDDRVISFGYPMDSRLMSASPGVYAKRAPTDMVPALKDELISDMTLLPGNSGGPLMNQKGEVVGTVNIASLPDKEGEPVQSYSIPVEVLNSQVGQPSFPPAPTDIAPRQSFWQRRAS